MGDVKKLIIDNELGFKALLLLEFLREQNIEIHYTSNNNHTSNSDIERLHNTINEHIIYIIYYNNSGRKPIDFRNGNINSSEYPSIREKIIKQKEKTLEKLNKQRESVEIQKGPVYLKDERGEKPIKNFGRLMYLE